jgi:hypothetical protein
MNFIRFANLAPMSSTYARPESNGRVICMPNHGALAFMSSDPLVNDGPLM